MIEIRCVKCNRLLFKSDAKIIGACDDFITIEIKCGKCGYISFLTLPHTENIRSGEDEVVI